MMKLVEEVRVPPHCVSRFQLEITDDDDEDDEEGDDDEGEDEDDGDENTNYM